MEMMRNLRHVNVDHLHVGWYQSTYYGSFINKNFLDSQFNYQSSIEESIVLIYGQCYPFASFINNKYCQYLYVNKLYSCFECGIFDVSARYGSFYLSVQ